MKDDFEVISQMTGIESIAVNKAWTEERRSLEVAAGDSERRLPLLPALCARLDAGSDPQRAGFHSVHGRDEGALGRLPAGVRMRCPTERRVSLSRVPWRR